MHAHRMSPLHFVPMTSACGSSASDGGGGGVETSGSALRSAIAVAATSLIGLGGSLSAGPSGLEHEEVEEEHLGRKCDSSGKWQRTGQDRQMGWNSRAQ